MSLAILHLDPPAARPHITPFAQVDGFAEHWWHRPMLTGRTPDWFAFTAGSDVDVARAEVTRDAFIGSQYSGVTIPADGFIEIKFFEVRQDKQRQGLGREAIRLLKLAYPGQTFAAFSEGGDEFWQALGWHKHLHAHEPRSRALFISPLDSADPRF